MKPEILQPTNRIQIIDALRGSALLGILLMHSVEHWDFMRYPEHSPAWLNLLNGKTFDFIAFLFSGKAYAIFAMMFGLSFFIILDRWSKKGIKFQGRFLWRLTVLGIIGYLHGIIYCGDILLIIAILGIPLVFLYKIGNRALLLISIILMLQIPSLWQVGRVLFEQGFQPSQPYHWGIYGQLWNVFSNGSFFDVSNINLWKGQESRLLWTFETGRYLQMIGLFIWGLLIGRSRIFEDSARLVRTGKKALLWGVVGFILLFYIKKHIGDWGFSGMQNYAIDNLVSSYCNLAQMAVWVGGFVWLYQWAKAKKVLDVLAPYGRMSLTCYVTQALIGVPLFYGYGFALFHYLGAFYSIFIGVAIFTIQCFFAHYWLKRYAYGPLEWLWRSLTFLSFTTPFRKQTQMDLT
jgi:uncharacterized protein